MPKNKQKKKPKPVTSKIVLEAHQVILRPLITEKTTDHSTQNNAYTFQVNTLATKTDVRRAIEELFDVRVDGVRTQNRHGKPRRTRFRKGVTADWKKAIVTLHEDDMIDFF